MTLPTRLDPQVSRYRAFESLVAVTGTEYQIDRPSRRRNLADSERLALAKAGRGSRPEHDDE